MATIALEPIVTPESARLPAIAALYAAAFPANERKPEDFLVRAIERDDYMLFAGIRDDALVGMALLYRSTEHAFALLEYMAVQPDLRGAGAGAALLPALAEWAGRPLVLEVESVLPGEPGADIRQRRIDFYRRNGCRQVANFAYCMPRVAAEVPPPMVLLVRGWPGDSIPGPTVSAWLADIYAHVYGRPANDTKLLLMQQQIGPSTQLV